MHKENQEKTRKKCLSARTTIHYRVRWGIADVVGYYEFILSQISLMAQFLVCLWTTHMNISKNGYSSKIIII